MVVYAAPFAARQNPSFWLATRLATAIACHHRPFGAGVRVSSGRRESIGSFGWDGAFGMHFWVDRKEQLVGLLMIEEPVAQLNRDFENAVMQAIVE